MLNERIFLIGGLLCVVCGLLLLGEVAVTGAILLYPVLGYPGVLFVLFGGIFLYVAHGARRERLELLRSGEEGVVGSNR